MLIPVCQTRNPLGNGWNPCGQEVYTLVERLLIHVQSVTEQLHSVSRPDLISLFFFLLSLRPFFFHFASLPAGFGTTAGQFLSAVIFRVFVFF
jgi:hypothetical protein